MAAATGLVTVHSEDGAAAGAGAFDGTGTLAPAFTERPGPTAPESSRNMPGSWKMSWPWSGAEWRNWPKREQAGTNPDPSVQRRFTPRVPKAAPEAFRHRFSMSADPCLMSNARNAYILRGCTKGVDNQ